MIRKILVALDGSVPAGKALDLAIDMTKAFDAELLAIHVVSDKPLTQGERHLAEAEYREEVRQALSGADFRADPGLARASAEGLIKTSLNVGLVIHTTIGRQMLGRAEEAARRKGVTSMKTVLQDGDPASTIVEVANREKPDLVIMGSRGLGGIEGLLLGSVSHKVSYSADCTVVIVK
jgi:nucleotide-binding universal stress UspA family protein